MKITVIPGDNQGTLMALGEKHQIREEGQESQRRGGGIM